MDIMEIILLAVGGIIFVLSFIIPDRKEGGDGNGRALAEDEVKALVSRELESVRSHVDDVVEEAVTYAMEKTERSLERLSNEKIMAVSEYSDTVLAEIHKNHEEVMFLYDMLNNKQINLKNTVSEINRTVKEAEETVTSFQRLAPQTSGSGGRILEGIAPSGTAAVRQEDFGGKIAEGADGRCGAGSVPASNGVDGRYGAGNVPNGADGRYGAGNVSNGADGRYGVGSVPNGADGGYGAGNVPNGVDGRYDAGNVPNGADDRYGAGSVPNGADRYGAGDTPGDREAYRAGDAPGGTDGYRAQNAQGGGKPSGRRNKKGASGKNASGRGAASRGQTQESAAGSALQEQCPLEESGLSQEAGGRRRGQPDSQTGNKEKILELYRQGKSPVEIAKDLELGIGEVRLVIDLFRP